MEYEQVEKRQLLEYVVVWVSTKQVTDKYTVIIIKIILKIVIIDTIKVFDCQFTDKFIFMYVKETVHLTHSISYLNKASYNIIKKSHSGKKLIKNGFADNFL